MSKHTNKVIDYLLENPQPNLSFAINSNACPPGNKWKEFVDKIKILQGTQCVRNFTLFVSAESKGKQAEYNRDGMDWQMFYENVCYYLKTVEYGHLSFMSAFNILSFTSFLPFLEVVERLKKGFKHRVLIAIPYVRNPAFLDAQIATKPLVEQYLYPALSFMKGSKEFTDEETRNLQRIIEDLEYRFRDPNKFGEIARANRRMFIEWIKQYDKRRGKDFHEVFPELKEFWLECKKCMI